MKSEDALMELTRTNAEQRLGALRRAGIVTSTTVTAGTASRLTVRVVELTDASKERVREALADTHWEVNIVEAAKSPTMTPAEQQRRFIEAAREAGCSEDEADFDRALGAIVKGRT